LRVWPTATQKNSNMSETFGRVKVLSYITLECRFGLDEGMADY